MTDPLIRASRAGGSASQDTVVETDRTAHIPVNGISHGQEDLDTPPAMPRWVKRFGIGAVVLFLLFAGLHLTGLTPMHGMPMHGVQLP